MKYIHIFMGIILAVSTSLADPPITITADTIDHTSYLVHISNQSTNDVIFRIGTNVGNGRYIFYDAISLIFDTLEGQEIKVESNWDNLAAIAGRLDQVFMALTPGATLSVPFNASNSNFETLQSSHLTTLRASLDSAIVTNNPLPIEYLNGNILSGTFESIKYIIDSQQSGPGYPPQGVGSPDP